MTRTVPYLVLALLTTSTVAAPVRQGPPPRPLTDPASVASPAAAVAAPVSPTDLFDTRGIADAAWTRDGAALVVSTNLTGRYNLWRVPADGGAPTRLTTSDDRQGGLAMSPDGRFAVFESDHAGDEIYDLHRVSLADGKVEDLTSTPDVTETAARFSPDGRTIAFESRAKTRASTDAAVMDAATCQARLLTHEAEPSKAWEVRGFTGDGRRVLANRGELGGLRSEAFLLDAATGAPTPLTAPGVTFVRAAAVTPDGRLAAVTYETPDGSKRAGVLDIAARTLKPVSDDVWEQAAHGFSPDGRTLLFTRNTDGRIGLFAYRLADGAVAPVGPGAGVDRGASDAGLSVSPDGARVALVHESGSTPPDLWTAPLTGGEGRAITRLAPAGLDPARLPRTRVVHYASRDGTVVSAILWTPSGLKRDGSAPAVVLPHGGPTGQTLDSFNRTAVALASRGYLAIAPNPRGSTGYGKAFELANRKDLGGGDLEDELGAVKFLLATGYVDARRVGITGGSYGGYMTLMAAAKAPDYWAAAVEEYGILDWVRMYRTEAPTLQQYQLGLIGDPDHDAEVYRKTSPLTYLARLKAPLLILQGDNDIRVPKSQAEALEAALRSSGRTVEAHYYPNEGHGFVKRENQIDALQRTLAWFDRFLKPAAK